MGVKQRQRVCSVPLYLAAVCYVAHLISGFLKPEVPMLSLIGLADQALPLTSIQVAWRNATPLTGRGIMSMRHNWNFVAVQYVGVSSHAFLGGVICRLSATALKWLRRDTPPHRSWAQ